ncbi:MAG TPA: ribosome recycling factor [Polyangiaceae bacterium]|nr:ribosome recycling factor [Polyangiaceae bacterium]
MIDDVLNELREAVGKAHEALKRNLSKVRTGRASAQMLDGVRVDYYGTATPLSQMASINVPEPRLLTIKPYDKTAMKAVEKAIREAELGFNPQTDSDLIRIPIPPLTEERRKEMVKLAKKYGEECKVAIRGARREALEFLAGLVDGGDVSEDEVERAKKKAEEVIAEATKKADEIVARKEKDVLEV